MELNIPERFQKDIETAKNLLKNEGCQEIYLFGSLVTGNIREDSDIDIGIKGLPPEKYFRVYSKLEDALTNKVDLVDFDSSFKFFNLLNSLEEVVPLG